jgi:hypothetical protein
VDCVDGVSLLGVGVVTGWDGPVVAGSQSEMYIIM